MTRHDLERKVRQLQGFNTDADRDTQISHVLRYREDRTEGDEPTAYTRGFFTPPGFQAKIDTDATSVPTARTVARYLGQAPDDLIAVTVRCNVTTAVSAAGFVWAELAIATSLEATVGMATVDLILSDFEAVGDTFNTTGVKTEEIPCDVSRGAHVWLLWGSEATTPFQLSAGIADPVQAGYVQFRNTTRPSTMANPETFAIVNSALNAAWFACQW